MGILQNLQDKISRITGTPLVLNEESIKKVLSEIEDPDLHQDIVSLGFVKNIQISGAAVSVDVQLTTPACPVKEQIQKSCEEKIRTLPGVTDVKVRLTAQTLGSMLGKDHPSVQSLGQVKNIIAVASGKGGVGKSTTSVNLAYALAAKGAAVGLLDADIYGPSLPLMTRPVVDPTAVNSNLVVPPEAHGVKVMSMGLFQQGGKATVLRGPMAAGVIKQFLSQVQWGVLDYLIIDYPPGTGDIQLTISQTAPLTGAVIVTTPQEVALIDVRKAVSMFETLKVPVLGVIETMSYFICDGCSKKHYIFREGGGKRLAAELGTAFIGEIPLETKVVEAADRGTPVVLAAAESPAAQAFTSSAGLLAAQVSLQHAATAGALQSFSLVWKND